MTIYKQICIYLELMLCEIENPHKRRLNFKGIFEYLEFTWAQVEGYVFVGGLIGDHNEGLTVTLRRSI